VSTIDPAETVLAVEAVLEEAHIGQSKSRSAK